jgi:hypothetical protein
MGNLGQGAFGFSYEVIRKHLKRRWIKTGRDPTRMTAERRALEMAFNPLIDLLSAFLSSSSFHPEV